MEIGENKPTTGAFISIAFHQKCMTCASGVFNMRSIDVLLGVDGLERKLSLKRRKYYVFLKYYAKILCLCEIRKALYIEPLLLRIEKSQLRWFGHVCRMPQERLARQVLQAIPTGKRPRGRPKTRWCHHISDLAWSCRDAGPAELPEIAVDREVSRVLLGLLSPRPLPEKSGHENEWMKTFYNVDQWFLTFFPPRIPQVLVLCFKLPLTLNNL